MSKIQFKDINTNNFNLITDNIIQNIIFALDECAPYKSKNLTKKWHRKPWIDKNVTELIFKRDTAFKVAKLSRQEKDILTYKKLRNQVVTQIKNNKRRYYEQNVDKNKRDSKKLWKSLKELIGDKKIECETLNKVNVSGLIINNPKDIANTLNKFFIDNVEKIVTNISNIDNYDYRNEPCDLNWSLFEMVTYSKLNKIVCNLDNNKGFGNDINAIIFKLLWETCPDIVLHMINKSLELGLVPTKWKTSIIIPIKKIKSSSNADDSRPINTLAVYEQVLERTVKDFLEQYLYQNNILNPNQSGFIKKHSCETALQNSFINWRLDLDKGLFIGVIYIDLKKAFETLNIQIMLDKLYKIGLRDNVLNWFESYLSGRKQKVKIGEILSEENDIRYGVPQGSILGPLLFLIYINDVVTIFKDLNINCKLFADDIMIYFSSDNISMIEKVLNESLKRLVKWLNSNQLKINLSKTVFMLIRNRRSKLNNKCIIKLEDNQIKEVVETKYLGIIIDNFLSFDNNANYVANKFAKKINVLYRLNHNVSNYTTSMIYKSIVAPHIDYCSSLMINYSQQKLDILQKLQNRAMRIILGVNKYTPIKDMLNALNWLSIRQRMIFNTCILIFKMVNGFAPQYLCDRVKMNADRSNYKTRNGSMISVTNTRTKSAEKSIIYDGFNWYNNLPDEICDQVTISGFKQLLVRYIKENVNV